MANPQETTGSVTIRYWICSHCGEMVIEGTNHTCLLAKTKSSSLAASITSLVRIVGKPFG